MTDSHGTTTYDYDIRDRVISKESPNGNISYTYTNGRLSRIQSLNFPNGADMAFGYDTQGRLETVTDNKTGKITNYDYYANGNLNTCQYPNDIRTTYTYNSRNRLTNLTISNVTSSAMLKSFAYTVGTSGNRTKVVEEAGRTANWTYDNLYRLTNETIVNDVFAINGSVGYTYDKTGNRQTRTSTLSGVTAQDYTDAYDDNDRLLESGYTYDNNGSTTQAEGWTYTYDAENKLKTATNGTHTLTYIYDGDGNRVSKEVDGTLTKYLVDTRNLTGYSQVIEELDSINTVKKRYVYGNDLISMTDISTSQTNYYGYDGTGSTRILTDDAGTITDTYDYDAFGILLRRTGTTDNNYLFHGEQYDQDLSQYYLRARYMQPNQGRFWGMDEFEGDVENPNSIHKYSIFNNNPILFRDPTGNYSLVSFSMTIGIAAILSSMPNVYAVPLQPGQAWNHDRLSWSTSDIQKFRDWIPGHFHWYKNVGNGLDCADFALALLIEYASGYGLPIYLTENTKKPLNSMYTMFRPKDNFLNRAMNYTQAKDLYDYNTEPKGTGSINNAQVGDLMMYKRNGFTENGSTYTGHTMVVLHNDVWNDNLQWAEGSLNKVVTSDNFATYDVFTKSHPGTTLRFWKKQVFGIK